MAAGDSHDDDDEIGDLDPDDVAQEPELETPAETPERRRVLELTGTVLGGCYKLEEHLATGGMGELWLAQHTGLGKEVVVKLVREELARDPNYVRALFREARVTAQLQEETEFIVPVTHVGEDQGHAYYVMESLRGMNLERYLKEQGGALRLSEGKRLLQQILEGLKVAHDKQVVHRDLKPSNIFIELKGKKPRARILDFGIANARDFLTTTYTQPAQPERPGTIKYMAPEQLTGQAPAPNPALDVFAIGLLAYQMFTGRHPFEGLLPAQLSVRYAAGSEAEPLDQLEDGNQPAAPKDVADVVGRALEFDPGKRFPDAGAMLAALDETNVVRPGELPVGTVVKGRYVIKRRLGTGGMGAVYEVYDRQQERRAALKIAVAPTTIASDLRLQFYARFDSECDVLYRHVRHEHVVRVFDKDRYYKHPYCVMEFVDGMSLAALGPQLWKQPDGWFRILRLLRQIATALDAIHGVGVIHRDIKPENIVIDMRTESAKLIDFGIAKVAEVELTGAGTRLGTPGFAAPEQLSAAEPGKPPRPVAASDQFGLAATVYYMLAGVRPGERRDVEEASVHIDRRILSGEIADLRELRPTTEVPAAVGAAVMRGLAVDPAERFDSVVAFVDAVTTASDNLNLAAAGRPTARPAGSPSGDATPTMADQPTPAPGQRHRGRLVLAALVVAAAATTVAIVVKGSGSSPQRNNPPSSLEDTVPPDEPADRAAPTPVPGGATDAAPVPTIAVQIVAKRRGKARAGVQLIVDGVALKSPATVERRVGQKVRVEVIDRRYRNEHIDCDVDQESPTCVVELGSARSRTGGRKPASDPDEPKPRRLLKEFDDNESADARPR